MNGAFSERLMEAFGLFALLFSVSVLLYGEIASGGKPPSAELTLESIQRSGASYLVLFRVRNGGGKTMEGLEVTGSLFDGDVLLERNDTTLDYVSPGGETRGGLFFTRDPGMYRLELDAEGYEEP